MSMKTNFDTVYVHYGDDEFDPDLVTEKGILSDWAYGILMKPKGLWAAPVDAKFGWKEWCTSEDFIIPALNHSFKFKLKDNARILEVHRTIDVLDYLYEHQWLYNYTDSGKITRTALDQHKLITEFDGMEVYLDNWEVRWLLTGWDVNSICIWNPDVVEEV